MSRLSKRAQGLQGTTALKTVQDLGSQVKGLLDKLTPMMQNLQASIPEINNALQQIQQLETQVGQLEQMSARVQQQAEQAKQQAPVQQSDDAKDGDVAKASEPKDRLKGGEADNVPEEKLNKKQLDMGQKVEMEHTDDPEIAREIARDHLSEELKDGKEKEDQEYYTKLKKVHEDKCNDLPAFWRRNLDYGSR